MRFHDVKNRAVFFFLSPSIFFYFIFYSIHILEKRTRFSINGSNLLKVNGFLVSIYERIGWFIDSFSEIYNNWKGGQKKETRLSKKDFFQARNCLWPLNDRFPRLDFPGRIVLKQWRINDRLIGAVPSVFKVAMLIVLSCSQPWILFSTSTSNKFLSNLYTWRCYVGVKTFISKNISLNRYYILFIHGLNYIANIFYHKSSNKIWIFNNKTMHISLLFIQNVNMEYISMIYKICKCIQNIWKC